MLEARWEYLSLTLIGRQGPKSFQINYIEPAGELFRRKPTSDDVAEKTYEEMFQQEAEAAAGIQTFGLINACNILGQAGWELTATLPDIVPTLMFKRPIR